MSPVPVVLCVCRWIGTSTSAFSREISENAASGSSRFAMSLMQITSAPICTSSRASFTK